MMFRYRCCELRDSIHRCRQPPAGRRTRKQNYALGNSEGDWFPVWHGNHDVHRQSL